MNVAYGYVAAAIAVIAGIWVGIQVARKTAREEQQRNMEDLRTYELRLVPPPESATNGQEGETEERKAA